MRVRDRQDRPNACSTPALDELVAEDGTDRGFQ